MQCYTNLIFRALSAYISPLLVHYLDNFLLVRPMDQQKTQLEVVFYLKCCIMGSVVGLLATEIRLAVTVVVKS